VAPSTWPRALPRALTAALAIVSFGRAEAQCSSEAEGARELVTTFATERVARPRAGGLPIVAASQIRLLVSPADSAACQRLYAGYLTRLIDPNDPPPADSHWTYYQVGNHYYLVVTRTSPVVVRTGNTITMRLDWTPILVFDANFQHVVTVGR
jgi:hypothetical protein